MDQRSRSLSPNDGNTRRQKEAEQHSLETSLSNKVQKLRAHHMIARGQHPHEWHAGTAEASPSGLDGQSARQTEDCSLACKEVSVLSNAWNEGKRLLSPEEEKCPKSIPIGENGKRAPKVVELSTHPTPDHPILVAGMNRFSEGETSQAGDEKLREQAHRHYDQACCYNKQEEYDKAKGEYDQAKNLYADVLADDKWQSTQNSLGTAKAMANLADIYTMERNFDEAVRWYERALPICERELGPKHDKTRGIRAKSFLGQQVGNYRLTQLLGYGGFGSVYFGEHTHLPNLPGAIKMLNQVYMADQKDKDAFYREAQILVDLKHENIVSVKEFGVKDNIPYLVMEYAPKGTLREAYPLGPKKPLSPKEVLTLARPIGAALQYMHDKNRVHLDLKPANVLLGAGGEVLLSDFGLAQIVHSTASFRRSELPPVAGTPPYMDPHYFQTEEPHPKHDQYAFGLMIFQWLTGQHWPLRDRDRNMQGMPSKIRKVVSRMLEPDLDKRYEHVKDAVKDLERACYGGIWKRRSIQEQVNNLKGENKILNRYKQALQKNVGNLEREKQALQDRLRNLELEKQAWQEGVKQVLQKNQNQEKTLQEMIQLVEQAFQQEDHVASTSGTSSLEKGEASSSSTGGERANHHAGQQRPDHSRNLRQQVDHQRQENENRDKVVQGPNPNVQETRHGRNEQKGFIGQMWQIMRRRGDGVEKQEVQVQEQVASTDRSILRHPERLTVIHTLNEPEGVYSVALSANGQTLVSGNGFPFKIWNTQTGELRRMLHEQSDSFALSADGQTLVSVYRFKSYCKTSIWNIQTGKLLHELSEAGGSIALSADGQTLVIGDLGFDRRAIHRNSTIGIWDLRTEGDCKHLSATMWCFDTGHAVCKVALSADGQTLVSRSWDGDIKIWNRNGQNWWYCHTLHEKRDSMAHMLIGNCDPMALSADGQTLVSGSWGGDIKIWKVKTGKLCHTFHGNYNSVALSADGQTLVSRDKNTIKIWDLQEWQCRRTLNEPFNSVALSANGQTMVSSNKNTIKIWGVK